MEKKIVFAKDVYFDRYPENVRAVTRYIPEITGKLYDIPGMS